MIKKTMKYAIKKKTNQLVTFEDVNSIEYTGRVLSPAGKATGK